MDLYDRQGQPITLEQWSALYEDRNNVIVERTEIGTEDQTMATVSTVWLGIDHGFGRSPVPIIFETMVFGGPLDEECWRYPTEDAARAGHDQACRQVEDAVGDGQP